MAPSRGHQHSQDHEALEGHPVAGGLGVHIETGLLHQPHKEHAREGAEDHNTFKGQVDDTTALGEHTGQRHDHQRHGIDQGLLNEECHASPPPSAVPPSGSGGGGGSAILAFRSSTLSLRRLRPLISIRITREKALR